MADNNDSFDEFLNRAEEDYDAGDIEAAEAGDEDDVLDDVEGGEDESRPGAFVSEENKARSLIDMSSIANPHGSIVEGANGGEGTIVRSAYLCGAHGVVIPKRGGVGVTGTVMKASAGAAARLPIARVSNLAQAIRTIKEHNIFVYCADLGGAPLAKTDLSGPVALVLGSEGGGPGALTRKLCDAAVTLEMAPGQATGVDSYNVSVAAGILCYDVMRRRLAKK